MATFRAVVKAVNERDAGSHLDKEIDVANFAAVLTNSDVSTALTEAQTKHTGETIAVKAWQDHAANADSGGGQDWAGTRFYVPTEIEFYNEHGTKITTLAPVVNAGDTLDSAVYDGFTKLYVTTPAIRHGQSQTLTISDNISSAFNATLATTATTLTRTKEGFTGLTEPFEAYEVQVDVGAGGRAKGTDVTGNITAAATLSTIQPTGTGPHTSYQYTAKSQTLAVAFTIG